MNKVISVGNMTDDPKVEYTQSGKCKAVFTLALNRTKEGADFPRYVAWEKNAELIERWCHKGKKLLVEGHLQTGSYEGKNGKVYTTDVVVDRIEFLDKKSDDSKKQEENEDTFLVPEGIDEEIPFS